MATSFSLFLTVQLLVLCTATGDLSVQDSLLVSGTSPVTTTPDLRHPAPCDSKPCKEGETCTNSFNLCGTEPCHGEAHCVPILEKDNKEYEALEEFIKYANKTVLEHPDIRKRENALADASYSLVANFFAFNGGIEKYYMYEDGVKEHYLNLKLSKRKSDIIEALDYLYDPHYVNWLSRLVAADPSYLSTFTRIAKQIAGGNVPVGSMKKDPKDVFKKMFKGNKKLTERAHVVISRELLRRGAKKLIDDLLDLALVVHECLFFQTHLIHILMDQLMNLAEQAEKHHGITHVWRRVESAFPEKYRSIIEPFLIF